MLDLDIKNILENSNDLDEFLEYHYLIRDRIFIGDDVLEILEQCALYTKEYNKLEEELDELKERHKELRDNVKRLAIKYTKLRGEYHTEDKEDTEDKEKIEAIRKELIGYKCEFVDKLQRILKT